MAEVRLPRRRGEKTWAAAIVGVSERYGLERQFVDLQWVDWDKERGEGTMCFETLPGMVFETQDPVHGRRYWYEDRTISREEARELAGRGGGEDALGIDADDLGF